MAKAVITKEDFPPTQPPYLRPSIWIFSRHSTNTYHTTLSHHWSSVLDKGKGAFVAALNIKGAFDQVWHNGQCAKLHASGKLLK